MSTGDYIFSTRFSSCRIGDSLRLRITAAPLLGKVNAAVELIVVAATGLPKSAARVVSEKFLLEKR